MTPNPPASHTSGAYLPAVSFPSAVCSRRPVCFVAAPRAASAAAGRSLSLAAVVRFGRTVLVVVVVVSVMMAEQVAAAVEVMVAELASVAEQAAAAAAAAAPTSLAPPRSPAASARAWDARWA